jgi:hypothetical protein
MDHSLEPSDTREELGAHSNPRSEPSDELPRRESDAIAHGSDSHALGDQRARDLNLSVTRVVPTRVLKQRRLEQSS